MKISWRDTKTNEEVLKLADERLYIVPTIKKRKIAYFGHMIRRNNTHRLLLEGPMEGKLSKRKAKNGVVDKHHRMDGNAIPRPRENCSRSGAMEQARNQGGSGGVRPNPPFREPPFHKHEPPPRLLKLSNSISGIVFQACPSPVYFLRFSIQSRPLGSSSNCSLNPSSTL